MKNTTAKTSAWGMSLSLLCALAGCSNAPEAAPPTSASDAQLTDSRIQSIQKDPAMSPADKEKAIAVLKSRQGSPSTPATPAP